MTKSYAEYFQNAFSDKDMDFNNAGYLKSHYEISGFCDSLGLDSMINSNVIGRIQK